jgi:hypothetical protein
MPKRIRMTLDGVEVVARLHEEAAPATVARFWAVLPIETTMRHFRWGGEAGYILVSKLAGKGHPIENPISIYPPATIGFRPEHGEFAFSYGQAQARDHVRTATWACHLATLEGDARAFLAKVAATCAEGGKPFRVAREEER